LGGSNGLEEEAATTGQRETTESSLDGSDGVQGSSLAKWKELFWITCS
jgi:hypothetical protein